MQVIKIQIGISENIEFPKVTPGLSVTKRNKSIPCAVEDRGDHKNENDLAFFSSCRQTPAPCQKNDQEQKHARKISAKDRCQIDHGTAVPQLWLRTFLQHWNKVNKQISEGHCCLPG